MPEIMKPLTCVEVMFEGDWALQGGDHVDLCLASSSYPIREFKSVRDGGAEKYDVAMTG